MLLKDKHIFIVEDNVQNRVIFQITLMKHGAVVEFERWGKDVPFHLERLAKIDLIILDLSLPKQVSGFNIFDEIRLVPEFKDVPIIAVSAMDPAIAIPEARIRGFSGFIAKPIEAHLFPEQVARVINGEEVWYVGEHRPL
ncbi:MAG: response regulator [Anaerolineae bacterium]|uniref:response regulator n=1 Tax=Candidatus Flexifilum breve TaxID=3140694 RepID=UPI001AC42A9B|nr:response regulator [Chloroflexota bacterium]MBK9745371.1 response regulator [Chloroflexota bacterium]MBN8638320.1 response regulator [Anaerolineae bacterium]